MHGSLGRRGREGKENRRPEGNSKLLLQRCEFERPTVNGLGDRQLRGPAFFRASNLPIPQAIRAAQPHSAKLLQRVVPRQHLRVGFAEVFRELFGDIHGTMLAAGATDGNGQITAIRLRELA
jgi:hypothetical protein